MFDNTKYCQIFEATTAEVNRKLRKLPMRCNNLFNKATGGLFELLGNESEELTYTRALAWFLNPGNAHKYGGETLRKLWPLLTKRGTQKGPKPKPDSFSEVVVTSETYTEEGRFDIWLLWRAKNGQDYCLAIEAKFQSNVTKKQLDNYDRQLAAMKNNGIATCIAKVLLTVEEKELEGWNCITFRQVAAVLIRLLGKNRLGTSLLCEFIAGILKNMYSLPLHSEDGELIDPFTAYYVMEGIKNA